MNMHCILLLFNDLLLIQSHASIQPSFRLSIHPPTCTYTAVHYTASCYIALHYITLHCVAVLSQFYHIILHYIPWHCVACYMALPTHTQIVYICTYIYIYYIQQRTNRTTISVCGRWLNAAWPGWRKIGRVRSVPRSASPNRVKYWKKYTIAHPPIAWDNGIETCTKLWFAPFDQFVVWLRDWKVWSTYIYMAIYIYGYIYIYI
jgi:hypothetical protein